MVACGGAASQPVQAPAPLPVADYARYPDYRSPVLSPNGRYLAVLVPINGRSNIAVVDLETHTSKVVTSVTRYDVLAPTWVGNERLIFSMGELNAPSGPWNHDGGGLFMVSRDGSESRVLAPTVRQMIVNLQFVGRFMRLLATLPDNDHEVLVTENARSADARDIYRLDATTGRKTLVTIERPERVYWYVLDRNRVPRVAMSSVKDKMIDIVWYRDNETAAWTELTRIDDESRAGDAYSRFQPLAFDDDNKTLIVAANPGRDTMALFRYEIANRKLGEMVAGHPRFDMGADAVGGSAPGLIIDRRSRRILGYTVEAEQTQTAWVDERMARLQAMMDRALPHRVNRVQASQTGGRVVVYSYDDKSSPEYWLFDEGKRKLEQLFLGMPWVKPGHLVEMRPFVLKTRDGLEVPSYYFLPRGHKPGDRHPTVVHIHGGPHSRADTWGASWYGGYGVAEAQMLASRGYAVVLPNHRITPGLGQRIYKTGEGTLGRQMSEDHEDAAKWAVAQGFADPDRMCIVGASYGGYATLRALVKTPELFRCGVAGLSVSDLERQLTSMAGDTAYSAVGQNYWRRDLIGENKRPGTMREIKAPLMLWAGSDDYRTPLEQTTGMVSALRSAGHEPEVMIKVEEGHGYGLLQNRIDLWEKMVEFLDRHIGEKKSH